jgi:hypothetical protein
MGKQSILKVIKWASLLSLAITLLILYIGCNKTELNHEEIDQIVTDAVTANTEAVTASFNMGMAMTTEFSRTDDIGSMTMAADLTGSVDNKNKEMRMTMNMNLDIPSAGKQEIEMELYIVDDWIYMKTDIPELGNQWNKMELTDELWETQNQINSQIALLDTANDTKLLGSENLNGTECHVVEIVPNMEALSELLSQQTSGLEGIDWKELKLFKEISVKEWIAKDSHHLIKQEMDILMEISPEDIGANTDDFSKMTITITMDMNLYDYNKPISVELPEAALEAIGIPLS